MEFITGVQTGSEEASSAVPIIFDLENPCEDHTKHPKTAVFEGDFVLTFGWKTGFVILCFGKFE